MLCQVALGLTRLSSENLQRWSFHTLAGLPVPVLNPLSL